MSKASFKIGDKVKMKKNLPLHDPNFRSQSPGWLDEMDGLIGKWGVISYIEESSLLEISFPRYGLWYVSEDWLDLDADPKYASYAFEEPKAGDWVVYYESDDDRELATLGKVDGFDEESKTWSIDGCCGFLNIYKFSGNTDIIDLVREGKI